MSLPRMRFTVRRMMVAVAVAAVLVWCWPLAVRFAEYRRLARAREAVCRTLSGEIGSLTEQVEQARAAGAPADALRADIDERRKALAEESLAASVYRDRMWRPWQPVRYRRPGRPAPPGRVMPASPDPEIRPISTDPPPEARM